MSKLFDHLRQEIIDTCIQCGECATICPSVKIARIDHIKPKEIQACMQEFVTTPKQDEIVSKRIDSCIECFKCVDSCPKGLNPLLFIEIAKTLSCLNGYDPYVNTTPENYASHYNSTTDQLNDNERGMVLDPTEVGDKKYLFFPGCNIYNDSPRVLKARAILSRISDDIAFLPGLKFCCGDRYLFDGRFDAAQIAYEGFTKEVERYNPDTVILWCPTCLARMKKTWGSDINCLSFFQFCNNNSHKLVFTDSKSPITATLHEPCKTAYTGLDDSHRELIGEMPQIQLAEMEPEVMCCGSGGISYYKENTLNLITRERLNQAVDTGADMLITVCHYCQELFTDQNSDAELEIVNLADLMFSRLNME